MFRDISRYRALSELTELGLDPLSGLLTQDVNVIVGLPVATERGNPAEFKARISLLSSSSL